MSDITLIILEGHRASEKSAAFGCVGEGWVQGAGIPRDSFPRGSWRDCGCGSARCWLGLRSIRFRGRRGRWEWRLVGVCRSLWGVGRRGVEFRWSRG